jgi:hypothetical protein
MSEKWVEVKFDFDFVNEMRVEVSDWGRIRTFNKVNDGKILKGSDINGYKAVALKFFKAREESVEKKLVYMRRQIDLLQKALTQAKKALKENVQDLSSAEQNALTKQIATSEELLLGLKEKYSKQSKKDLKSRTIHFSVLQHRLIAEYFCKKPSAEHNLVIHLNFNKQDNRAVNLKWVTQVESTAHQQKSPYVINEKKLRKENPKKIKRNTKLTESKVRILKKRMNEGKMLSQLAEQFGVSHTQLLRIKRGINWAEVEPAA